MYKNLTWSHDGTRRSAIGCKLRLSNHKLKIEVGRHSKSPLDERICKACSLNEIEDEVHFLYNCTAYSSIRNTLFDDISSEVAHFNTLTQEGQLKIMFQPRGSVAALVSACVHECFNLRKTITIV